MMRLRVGSSVSILLVLAAFLAWGVSHFGMTSESRAGSVEQFAMAIDGDTIQLKAEVFQLYGIDAPELGQYCMHDGVWNPCGQAAAFELNKQLRLSRREVKCYPANGADSTERICFAGDVDVAEAMLMAGYVAVSANANPDYRELEDKARVARLGLWHSEFVDPSAWRQGERLPDEPSTDKKPCPIKAVMSQNARGVYYVPTDEDYESITVDPSRGDRLYCSDEAARQDGWRRQGEAAGP